MTDLATKALESLPHGPEFRFIDKLVRLEPGKAGTGEYTIRADAHFLKGHFPGNPLFPGVLLVEAAAQLAGTVAQSDPDLPPMPGLKLTAMKGVKIYGSAKPGEVIQLEAYITGRLGNLVQARTMAFVDKQMVLQAEITLSGEVNTNGPVNSGQA